MTENRLSSTLKDSGFELYFDPVNGMFSRLYELGHLNILHIFSWKIAGDICMCRVYGRLL